MVKQLVRLYPQTSATFLLDKLYLQHDSWYDAQSNKPKVVANFLMSLDGRIAITPDEEASNPQLPKSLTSKEDFRLFLELYAQADCLITHGGYLRTLAKNRLGNILQLPSDKVFEDLHIWRQNHGLKPHPDIVIASSSLNFPMHPSLHNSDQTVFIATGQSSNIDKRIKWQKEGYEVLLVGKHKYAEGAPLIKELEMKKYQHIYLIAGPKMLHTMVQDKQLDKLYISSSHQLLGGDMFRTLLDGDVLTGCTLKLNSLFFDEASENDCGQFFSSYKCIYN